MMIFQHKYPLETFDVNIKNLKKESDWQLFLSISDLLLQQIKQAPKESYLLPALIDFLEKVKSIFFLKRHYKFFDFEFYLNHFSGLSIDQQLEIRGKIAGRYLPREEYSLYFPIGMNKYCFGSHLVAGHLSPDIDATVASFWGWLDAFAAKIGTGMHYWSLPGEIPASPVVQIIENLFSKGFFDQLARFERAPELMARDLVVPFKTPRQASSSAIALDTPLNALSDHNFPIEVSLGDQAIGTIDKEIWNKKVVGTVTERDFCNLNEINLPSKMEVVSVIDHHKAIIQCSSPPCMHVADVQSSNVLIAEIEFRLNDHFSTGGMAQEQIEKQIAQLEKVKNPSLSQLRILKKLFQRKIAFQATPTHYVHPKREFDSYLCFLYAILDDTDLLSKVGDRDVKCVAELLNRMKSLALKEETEIVDFDDIVRDTSFAKNAAKRLLKHDELHAIYKNVYDQRAIDLEQQINCCVDHQPHTLFIDTKVQNGCAKVGQVKFFAKNFPHFEKNRSGLIKVWQEEARKTFEARPEVDLHIEMISTVPHADEVILDHSPNFTHHDELWLWIPKTDRSIKHLETFLKGFSAASQKFKESLSIEISSHEPTLKQLFSKYFGSIQSKETPFELAILKYQPGAVNSRKSMISPYLPV